MKRLPVCISCLLLFFSACNPSNPSTEASQQPKEAKGGRTYGGVFRLNESEYIKNLFPPSITDAFSYRVATQVYEGLLKFNQSDLKVINCLAENYTVDASRTVYTFKIKKGVYFHDDPCFPEGKGRELKAEDVKYCFTQLCTQRASNQQFSIFKGILKGADRYYEATAGGGKPGFEVEGINVLDAYTVQLTLEKPNSILIYNLARPATFLYPREAYEKYGQEMRIKTVGTGPFRISSVDDDVSLVLKRHDNYHGVDSLGNRLPFLDAISIKFIKDKKTELFEFRKGELDMVYRLPTDFIIEILEQVGSSEKGEYSQFELQRAPEMITQFLTFFNQGSVFKEAHVRKAFSYAVDRQKILENVLNGEGFAPGFHGITPPSFVDYNINALKGYELNVDSARYHLAKAGFPNGKGFPKIVLDLNAEGSRNTNVAIEVQKQLKDNLNVEVSINVQPLAQTVDKAIAGKFQLLRAAWSADYPSPENFLWLFYGKQVPASLNDPSYPNIARYKNAKFDRLYEAALSARSVEEANRYFIQAEQILMNDAPVLVLWYDEGYRLIQSYVKNFPNNPMQYRDLSEVYLERPADGNKQGS
ncbi:MAG: ABC transporter substrate-binding protein [Ferruginibacter sp.]|nr:ABC transporter substrate-binding protein [Cytophagales bacterium]